nr:hypothetical protein [Rhabdochlamydiaceae bacterium]
MQKVTSTKNYYVVNSGSSRKISLAEIEKYKFGFDLWNLRDRKIDTFLQINNLARRSATIMGNNCLLDSIFQQIQPLIPNVTLLEFASLIRERVGKTNGEQLSINDDLEGTQIWTAVQAYLQQMTNDLIYFEFSVLFADNEGEIALIDMSGIESALKRNGIPIPLRIIFVNYNHYEPVFKAEEIPEIEERLKDLSLESSRKTSISQQPLPAYVVNMPLKVDSDDEGEISSDEEVDGSFPPGAFQSPDKYFRLRPEKKEARRGTIINPISVEGAPIKSLKKGRFPSLIPLFEKEVSQISSVLAEVRIGISVGFNKMRSLSQRRNGSLLRSLNEQTETSIPIGKIGFLWDGIWQKSTDGGKTWGSTGYDNVRSFYKQLKKFDPSFAEEFRKATEKHRAHMVPYREIRDAIKNHEETKKLANLLRSINKMRDIYILFLDSDILSFRYRKDAPGALSIFDENYLSSPFEIASTGYTIREPDNLVLEIGILADLAVRNATAKHVKRGVYFPEPCTAVKIPKDSDTVPENFSDTQDKDYASPQEMPRLIDKVLKMRKLDPQKSMVFDSRGAIVTTLPNRMQRDFQCHSTQRNGIILWGLADFKTMRGINQTHYSAYDWAHRMLEALLYHKELRMGNFMLKDAKVIQDVLISLLSRLFNAFDPVELAQRAAKSEGLPFQICLIRILRDYKGALNDTIPKTNEKRIEKKPRKNAKDREKAVQKSDAINSLWRWADSTETVQTLVQNLGSLLINDLSKNILAATHESGAAIVELFKNRLCLNYQELVIYALSVLIEKDEVEVNIQMPKIYLAMISDVSIIQPG